MSLEIANSFLQQYYQAMTNNRESLVQFYAQNSVLSYERKTYTGLEQIIAKFQSLTFQKINYQFDEYDVQPSPIQGGMLIVIIGTLQMDQEIPMKFSQTFQLIPNVQGGFYISNDIFRFIMA